MQIVCVCVQIDDDGPDKDYEIMIIFKFDVLVNSSIVAQVEIMQPNSSTNMDIGHGWITHRRCLF